MRRAEARLAMGRASDSRTAAARGSNAAPMQGGPRVAEASSPACRASQAAASAAWASNLMEAMWAC